MFTWTFEKVPVITKFLPVLVCFCKKCPWRKKWVCGLFQETLFVNHQRYREDVDKRVRKRIHQSVNNSQNLSVCVKMCLGTYAQKLSSRTLLRFTGWGGGNTEIDCLTAVNSDVGSLMNEYRTDLPDKNSKMELRFGGVSANNTSTSKSTPQSCSE